MERIDIVNFLLHFCYKPFFPRKIMGTELGYSESHFLADSRPHEGDLQGCWILLMLP